MQPARAILAALLLLPALAPVAWAECFPIRMRVAADQPTGPLAPIWRFFGADEPNYASMPHGRELLGELGDTCGRTTSSSAPTTC